MTFDELPAEIQRVLEVTRRRFEKDGHLYPHIHAHFATEGDAKYQFKDADRARIETCMIVAVTMGADYVCLSSEGWKLNLSGASQQEIEEAVTMAHEIKIREHERRQEVIQVLAESAEKFWFITAPIKRTLRQKPRLDPWDINEQLKSEYVGKFPVNVGIPRFQFVYEKARRIQLYASAGAVEPQPRS